MHLGHKCILNVITYTKLFAVARWKFFWGNDSTAMLIFPYSKMRQSRPSKQRRGQNWDSERYIVVTPKNQHVCIKILAVECELCEYNTMLKGKKTQTRNSSISL